VSAAVDAEEDHHMAPLSPTLVLYPLFAVPLLMWATLSVQLVLAG
jgi:hypothetical protein